MEFVHRPYQPGETIVAIATPLGVGGIAIVRISGHRSLDVASVLFLGPVKSYKTHTAHFGKVIDRHGEKIDDALLLVMHGPRSFTGEDTVEIQCHGGAIIPKKIVEEAVHAGARVALPGEFSFKAFMNGKLDLSQAESIQSLIAATSERAQEHASHYLEGTLSKKIAQFQADLTEIAAIFEAWVDFPDEGIEFAPLNVIEARLVKQIKEIDTLLSTFHDGKKLSAGIKLSIVGAPNVGKSSLLNALLDKERAIVTPIAGTTRDLLEEEMTLNGLSLRLVDTAGIRDSDDPVEKEGIRRSRLAIDEADLILMVFDATREISKEEKALFDSLAKEKTIPVLNKLDVAPQKSTHEIQVSAKEKIGLDRLKAKIDEVIWKNGPPEKQELILSNVRHKEALVNASCALKKALSGIQKEISPEFLLSDIRAALFELGTIIGKNVTEEILNSIFSQFCIGK